MPSVLQASWIGRRVVVRRVVGRTDDGALTFGDIVGDLLAVGEANATVDARDGRVEVPLAHIALAKIAEPSAAQMLDLQRIAALGMRPVEQVELAGWQLRFDPDTSHRANSVRPLGAPGMPIGEALEQVQRWYRERGKPAGFLNPTECRRLLDAELGERGWTPGLEVSVLAARLDTRPRAARPADIDYTSAATAGPGWQSLYRAGSPTAAKVALLSRHDTVTFVEAVAGGRTVGIARGVVDEGWLGVGAIAVLPEFRRRGIGTALVETLADWGTANDASRAYLEVSADDDAAIALYTRMGFWRHHDYRYRWETDGQQREEGPEWPAPVG